MCLLSACSLFGGSPQKTTASTTAAGNVTTAAAHKDLPDVDALEAALEAAAPTSARITMTSHHAAMGADLQTDCYLLMENGKSYYYYESEYFLPLTEALACGEAIGTRTGYLLIEGDTVRASSAEIDNAILNSMRDYSIHTPNLRTDLYESQVIEKSDGRITLTMIARSDISSLIYDNRLDGARDISVTIVFTEADLLPISLSVGMTRGGIPLSYSAAYSYAAVTFPTGDAVASPDPSIWQ